MNLIPVLVVAGLLGQTPDPGGTPAPPPGAGPAAGADKEAWTPLFNGNDLSGWADADAGDNGSSWEVAGGAIEGRGGGRGKPAILVTERKDFKDFKLRVVYGCRTEPGLGFVQVRRTPQAEDAADFYAAAAEVAGKYPWTRQWPSDNISKWRGYQAGGRWPVPRSSEPVKTGTGSWHTLECHVIGDTITTYVNGREADRFTDRKGVSRSGGIALFVGGDSAMQFREISIDESPAE